jgi:hypothetical protein
VANCIIRHKALHTQHNRLTADHEPTAHYRQVHLSLGTAPKVLYNTNLLATTSSFIIGSAKQALPTQLPATSHMLHLLPRGVRQFRRERTAHTSMAVSWRKLGRCSAGRIVVTPPWTFREGFSRQWLIGGRSLIVLPACAVVASLSRFPFGRSSCCQERDSLMKAGTKVIPCLFHDSFDCLVRSLDVERRLISFLLTGFASKREIITSSVEL